MTRYTKRTYKPQGAVHPKSRNLWVVRLTDWQNDEDPMTGYRFRKDGKTLTAIFVSRDRAAQCVEACKKKGYHGIAEPIANFRGTLNRPVPKRVAKPKTDDEIIEMVRDCHIPKD